MSKIWDKFERVEKFNQTLKETRTVRYLKKSDGNLREIWIIEKQKVNRETLKEDLENV